MLGAGTMNLVPTYFILLLTTNLNYNDNYYNVLFTAKELGNQLENWLGAAELTHGPARAIIAPYVSDYSFQTFKTIISIIGDTLIKIYIFTDMPDINIVVLVLRLPIAR